MLSALSFQAPLLLAGLVALPLIWWLLRATPPAPREVSFGGLFFLTGLRNDKESPDRTPWWLLLIRLLAVGLLILGFAGPVMNANREAVGTGPLLLIVDDTWPAAPGWSDRQEVVEALSLARGASERPTRILRTGGEPTLSDPVPLTVAAREIAGMVPTATLPDRAAALDLLEAEGLSLNSFDVYWLSDGFIGRTGADREFLRAVGEAPKATLFKRSGDLGLAISGVSPSGNELLVNVHKSFPAPSDGLIIAQAADGRVLGQAPFAMAAGDEDMRVPVDLPLTLRNEVARLQIQGLRSAGATWITDSRSRRIRAGLVTEAADSLLNGGFYIEQALTPFAQVATGVLPDFLNDETGMIVLDDIGTLRDVEEGDLLAWVREGGVLVRFAGPNTANAAREAGRQRSPTLPITLRGSERSLGGALTWEEPQNISDFASDGPFADLPLGEEIPVRRQVLSLPITEPDVQVWARLADGTPLVTARAEGQGFLVLFHVTATPTWSDLPIAGIFPEMLSRLTLLSSGRSVGLADQQLAPFQLLDGYGGLISPTASTPSIRLGQDDPIAPGLYGTPPVLVAVNTYADAEPMLDPLTGARLPSSVAVRGPDSDDAHSFGPWLLVLALLLLAADALSLILRRPAPSGAVASALSLMVLMPIILSSPAKAQADFRPDIDRKSVDAALEVKFAFVITGDRETDYLSERGLFGLTREAIRRSALEPSMPIGVDIERDDLSVYPLLYWPIVPGLQPPSDEALSNLEQFMDQGGLLLIDTRDGERQTEGMLTAEGRLLRSILLRMNIPPLEPFDTDSILAKSFYYLEELHGRNTGGPVWIEAPSALRESTDGVPSLIIAGRDWASAWAVDDGGRPIRAPGAGGELRREYAYRTGINLAMVALTGNYKADQVHVKALLDRLGQGAE